MRLPSMRDHRGTTSSMTLPFTRINSRTLRSMRCGTSPTARKPFFSLAFPRKNTVAADEVLGRMFHAVDPAPKLGDLVAPQYLGNRGAGQIADDVLLVVVLATEDALAARGDMQMLQRTRADIVTARELALALRRLDTDVQPARPIHDYVPP